MSEYELVVNVHDALNAGIDKVCEFLIADLKPMGIRPSTYMSRQNLERHTRGIPYPTVATVTVVGSCNRRYTASISEMAAPVGLHLILPSTTGLRTQRLTKGVPDHSDLRRGVSG